MPTIDRPECPYQALLDDLKAFDERDCRATTRKTTWEVQPEDEPARVPDGPVGPQLVAERQQCERWENHGGRNPRHRKRHGGSTRHSRPVESIANTQRPAELQGR